MVNTLNFIFLSLYHLLSSNVLQLTPESPLMKTKLEMYDMTVLSP